MSLMNSNPTPFEIRAMRKAAGLTQTAAAALVHTTCRTWQQWEAVEDTPGHRNMHPAFWELFRIKIKAMRGLERQNTLIS